MRETDLQRFRDMLLKAAVSFQEETRQEDREVQVLRIDGGYTGFYTLVVFDQKDGSLLRVGSYED